MTGSHASSHGTGHWHLFLDDTQVASRTGVQRTVHTAIKYAGNPILVPEPPWEGAMVPSTVLFDPEDQTFKMWYLTHARVPGVESTYVSGFATSTDGMHWHRPEIGDYEYEGSRRNNLCLGNTPGGMGVIVDHHDPDPARRFKALVWHGGNRSRTDTARGWGANERRGFYAFSSPDGAHWSPLADGPVLSGTGDTASLFGWDEQYGRYVAYVRPGRSRELGEGVPHRVIGRSLSTDFATWTSPVDVLLPDADDPPLAELYYMPVQRFYGQYVGIPHVFVPSPDPFGPFWPELATSRDGIRWTRVGHQPLIEAGEPGSFDCGMRRCARGIVERGDELWLYYGGWREDHGTSRQHRHMTTPRAAQRRAAAIGLAKLRLDGFVSLDAGEEEGTITTAPERIDRVAAPLRLLVNAVTHGPGGYVAAEVLAADGTVLPGYSLVEVDRFAGDSVAHELTWQGRSLGTIMRAVASVDTIALRFRLRRASLYAYAFVYASSRATEHGMSAV